LTDIDAFYRAPGRLSARALGERLQAALALERVHAGRVTRTWYDTFDWRLYAAGHVLEHDRDDGRGRLHLRALGATTALAAAPAGTVPRFAHELPAGSLHQCLAPLVKMRALLPLGSCTLRSVTLEGKDAAGKTRVRLVLETPARGERAPPGVLVRLEALRGYEKEAGVVARQLGEHGLAALARDPLDAVLARAGRRPLDYSAHPAIELSPALPAAAATACVLAAYLQVMRANEPGNKLYQLVRNKKNPQEYAVMELYEDEAALEAHREQPHFKDAQPKLGPCLAGKPDIKYFDTVG